MNFEQVIAALNELVGSEVVVKVAGADECPPVVFVWTGVLRAGMPDDLAEWIHGARWSKGAEVTYFGLDDSHGRGFYVSGIDFRGARYEPLDGHDALAVDLGNVILHIRGN